MRFRKYASTTLVVSCLFFALFFAKAYLDGHFSSVESLQRYVHSFGLFAPVILTIFQAMQVVVPVLPGFLGCAVGATLFGSIPGFLCNYIGISVGSLIAFHLARKYGVQIVEALFSKEHYHRYAGWAARSRSYSALLFLGTILPLFPDDFFCYFSGLTKMTWRRFTWIILLGKPWCILAYSFAFAAIIH